MSATELPPLPKGRLMFSELQSGVETVFSATQMTAYALQCIAEGCTPTDIRVLRQANVDLAAESERLKLQLIERNDELVRARHELYMLTMKDFS